MQTKSHIFNNYSQQKYSQNYHTGYIYFWITFLNIAQMPKKPFSLRSVQFEVYPYQICKKNEKIRSGVSFYPKSRNPFFL